MLVNLQDNLIQSVVLNIINKNLIGWFASVCDTNLIQRWHNSDKSNDIIVIRTVLLHNNFNRVFSLKCL